MGMAGRHVMACAILLLCCPAQEHGAPLNSRELMLERARAARRTALETAAQPSLLRSSSPSPSPSPSSALLPPPPPAAPAAPRLITSSERARATPAPFHSFCIGVSTSHRCQTSGGCAAAGRGLTCDERTDTCVCTAGACVDAQSGECRALGADATVRARVWRPLADSSASAAHPNAYPESADAELVGRTANVGVALVGSGALGTAASAGVLRGLHALGLLLRLRFLAASGGGALAALGYAYADEATVPSDAKLLGQFVPPEQLGGRELNDEAADSLVAAASADVWSAARAALAAALASPARPDGRLAPDANGGVGAAGGGGGGGGDNDDGGAGTLDEVWERAVVAALLKPLGLGRRAQTLGWSASAHADFAARNPRFKNASAHLPRRARPFLVLAASVVGPTSELAGLAAGNGDGGAWPPWATAPHEWGPLLVTSAYTGVPALSEARFERAPTAAASPDAEQSRSGGAAGAVRARAPAVLSLLTGGWVENLAIGGGGAERATWLQASRPTGLVALPMPTVPFSLARVAAASSARLSTLIVAEADRRRAFALRAAQLEAMRAPIAGETAAQWAERLELSGIAHLAYEHFASTATWLDVLVAAAPRLNYWSAAHAPSEGTQPANGAAGGASSGGSGASGGAPQQSAAAVDVLVADASLTPEFAIASLLARGVRELVLPVVGATPLSVLADAGSPSRSHVDPSLLRLFVGGLPTEEAAPSSALFVHVCLRRVVGGLVAAKSKGRAAATRAELTTAPNKRLGVTGGARVNVTVLYLDRNFEWEHRLGFGGQAARQLLQQIDAANEVDAAKQCVRGGSASASAKPQGARCEMLGFPNLQRTDVLPTPAQPELHEFGELAPGAPSTRYAALANPDVELSHSDRVALDAAWAPLPRAVANAVAALAAFSTVSIEPLLREAFGVPPTPGAAGLKPPSPESARSERQMQYGSRLAWVGCHADRPEAPQLPHFRGVGLSTTLCAQLCAGYPHFALQGPDAQCRCGTLAVSGFAAHATTTADAYRKVDDRECGRPCAGEAALEPQRLCGSRARNAIFRMLEPPRTLTNVSAAVAASRRDAAADSELDADAAEATGAAQREPVLSARSAARAIAPVVYIGCVPSSRGGGALPFARGVGHTTTSCAAVCRAFALFALVHGRGWGECFCGDSLADEHEVERELSCGEVCDGEEGEAPTRYCGTHAAAAVYQSTGCHDSPSWSNPHGYTCSAYVAQGWCGARAVVDASQGGEAHRWPEQNCCACGRGATAAASALRAETRPIVGQRDALANAPDASSLPARGRRTAVTAAAVVMMMAAVSAVTALGLTYHGGGARQRTTSRILS